MEISVKLSEADKEDIANLTMQKLYAIINEKMMPVENPDDLVTVKSIAEKYNLHQRTITNRIDARHIEKERLGHYVAVRRKHIDELLKKSA